MQSSYIFYTSRFFLFYFLFLFLCIGDKITQHRNESALRYLQIRDDRFLKLIARHLKISEHEREKVLDEAKRDMSADFYEIFEKDIKSL